MPNIAAVNRFLLFGLFVYRADLPTGYPESGMSLF